MESIWESEDISGAWRIQISVFKRNAQETITEPVWNRKHIGKDVNN